MVFHGRVSSPIQRALAKCDDMSLANTGSLYLKVPLRCFARLKRINLSGTTISTKHFLQMVKITRRLRVLDIESCGKHIGIHDSQSKRIAPIHDKRKHFQ